MSVDPKDVDCDWDRESVQVPHDGIKHQTDKAVLFEIGGSDVWIPKSCIESVDADEVWVAEWFSDKEGLI